VNGRDRDRRAPVVVAKKVSALGVRQELRECAPWLRKDAAHSVHEPVDLGCGRKKDSAQHEAETARRMRLRVSERKRRPPRAAEYEPAVDMQMLAQPLEVVDQRLRGVALRSRRSVVERPAPRWSSSTMRQNAGSK
jgi:hypothetical protein